MSSARFAMAAYATTLVGAPAALDALSKRREAGARLLWLHGAPGVGKTRAAIEWTRAYAARMGFRAAFVELATTESLHECVIAVIRALGGRLDGASPLGDEDLVRAARRRLDELGSIVLVLDDVDRMADFVEQLAVTLLEGNHAIIVLTARARIASNDASVEVRPLRVPAPRANGDEALRSPAVALFIDRARSIWRDYKPSGLELDSIAAIVRSLDGLPLAIELASSRLAVATAAQLAPLVGPSIDVLVAPERGLDLRAVIEQSWATLALSHQRLLARLSLCEGGFDLELAARLALDGEGDTAARRIACIDALHALVRRSLLESFAYEAGARRFRVLEPIRMFAAAKLDESGERREAESAFVRAMVDMPAPTLLGAETLDELRSFLREERNYLRALALAEASDEHAAVLALLVKTSMHFRLHGPIRWWIAAEERSRPRLERLADARYDTLREDMLVARAQCSVSLGHLDESREVLLSLTASEHSDRRRREVIAWAHSKLSVTYAQFGERELSAEHRDRATALLDGCSDSVRFRIVRDQAWVINRAGDADRSERLYREALALATKLEYEPQYAPLYSFLANCEFDRGATSEAAANLSRAIEYAERSGDHRTHYACVGSLAVVYIELGRYDEARAQLRVALDNHVRYGDRWHEAETRMYFGLLSLELGAHAEAERWFREAIAIHETTGDVGASAMAAVGRALACVELGDGETARALVRALEAQTPEIDRAAVVASIEVARRADDLVRARQLAAVSKHDEAERLMGELRAWLRGTLADRPVPELRFPMRALLAMVERVMAQWGEGVRGARTVEVAFDGSWVRIDGVTIELARTSERKIVLALARSGGGSLSIEALFDAGWKGERASTDAKVNRVRVALTGLRRAGLRSVIERTAEGYRLSPDCVIELLGA